MFYLHSKYTRESTLTLVRQMQILHFPYETDPAFVLNRLCICSLTNHSLDVSILPV